MSTSKPVAEPQAVEAEGPDGGWGWILVGALFASITFAHGLIRCSGILFVEFVQYFEENALHVSWVFSTGAAVLQLSSPVAAALSNAFTTKVVVIVGGFLSGLGLLLASQATCLLHLYLTVGVISGLGSGLVFVPMMASVTASFTRRRSLALSVASSSLGFSSLALNPLLQLLVDTYTWRGALLIMGGLSFNNICCGALIRTQKIAKTLEKENSESRPSCAAMYQQISSYLGVELLFERPFLTYVLASFFMGAGINVPFVLLVAHGLSVGFSENQATAIISASGATDILGRLVSGWFADLGHFRLIHLTTLWMSLAGVSIVLLPVSSITGSYPALMVMSLIYGFTYGAMSPLTYSLMPKIVGLKRVTGALGLQQLVQGFAGLFGVPLSGWLRDVTGNYVASFVVAGSFLILSSLTMATLPHFLSRTDPPPPQ